MARWSHLVVVTMLRLTPRRRRALSDTMRELANLSVAALGLSQFVGQPSRSWGSVVAGVLVWLTLVTVALVLEEE